MDHLDPIHPTIPTFLGFSGLLDRVEDLQGTSADLPQPHLSPILPPPPLPRRSAPNPAF